MSAADASKDPAVGSKVPSNMMGEFYSFIRNLGSFTGDLSALTCPSFLLNGDSLLEYLTHWGDQPALLAQIPKESASEERMVAVCRWFISTLYGSYYVRSAASNEKKPFNPILGEQFLGHWDTENEGTTFLTCEQVSHHPPISAFFLENESAGIFANGHTGQKSKFTGTTIKITQTGFATVHLTNSDEQFTICLPDLYIRSLLTGKPFMEVVGNTWIQSSKGYTAVIQFQAKPWFGGEYHRFKGSIYSHDPEFTGDPLTLGSKSSSSNHSNRSANATELYTMEGRWMAKSTVTHVPTKKTKALFDATTKKPVPIHVLPVSEQGPLESRRVWHGVSHAINSGDYSKASAQKSVLENEQRRKRKKRTENNHSWSPNYFTFVREARLVGCRSTRHLDSYTAEEHGRWVFNRVLDKLTTEN
ncbi:Oxysterol-binding protein 4 [Dimargaris verticillata]|uniref:Oxysterol-binding protein 4 n=1 Tax=Dimargaris verticillata TaxID=2761393 RepID=A0A9W8E8H9_9FUNG|nr:Oxysterol-binding protein 4 [Dimargaris verticillata]